MIGDITISSRKLLIELAKRNMNYRELSESSGVSRTTLSKINQTKYYTPNKDTLDKICSALEISCEVLER